jgi:hypothetical protein
MNVDDRLHRKNPNFTTDNTNEIDLHGSKKSKIETTLKIRCHFVVRFCFLYKASGD